jgi:prophage DNA circulation protein
MANEWNITDGSFQGLTFHVAVSKPNSSFGMMSQDITNERRLQISEKPRVDGAEIEDFGRKPRVLTAEIIFFGLNYQADLRTFEDALNQGKSGVLILPDLDEAVYAKYQRHSRKTSHQDGSSTMLSVTWVEDRTTQVLKSNLGQKATLAELRASAQKGASEDVQDALSNAQKNADAAQKALSANTYLNLIAKAERQVVKVTTDINSVLNIPKALKQDIISSQQRMASELANLQAALKGAQNFTSLLSLAFLLPSPTPSNTTVGAIDFTTVDQPITAIVTGTSEVVQAPVVQTPNIQSYTEATAHVGGSTAIIAETNRKLETSTQGKTADVSKAVVKLVNSVKDLLVIIESDSTKLVMTDVQTTLLEVCFKNGLPVSDIDRVYKLNTQLNDILNIAPFTVVSL